MTMKSKKAQNVACAWCGNWTGSWRKKICDECEQAREEERKEEQQSVNKSSTYPEYRLSPATFQR